jgi:hypothetical protein
MSASPFVRTEARADRASDAPIMMDLASHTARASILPPSVASWVNRLPRSWIGMSGYLAAGVVLGLVLIIGLSLTRSDAPPAAAGVVTDNVVHLTSAQIGAPCWRGTTKDGPARVTVSLEVGLDGKVRNAVAAGESAAMRSCIESHVKSWEFLPQAVSSQMVLPFEIEAR